MLENGKITVNSGRFFRRSRIIDYSAVIYYERRIGPIGWLFGLCSISLHLTHRSIALYGLNAVALEKIEAKIK